MKALCVDAVKSSIHWRHVAEWIGNSSFHPSIMHLDVADENDKSLESYGSGSLT